MAADLMGNLRSVGKALSVVRLGGIHVKASQRSTGCDGDKVGSCPVLCCAAGTREGVMFLREHGVPIPLAQRVADKWGASTRALVERDPYAALAGLGLGFK